jgi:ADP-heptose:LPS heptosyltransferase
VRPHYATERLKPLDRPFTLPACLAGRVLSWTVRPFRRPEQRPLVLRPGGMGDLILAQVALEELGVDPQGIDWLIERRSAPWARHAGLPHSCYDHRLIRTLAAIAGTRKTVVDSEQRFGLSQALSLVAVGRGGALVGFDTNRGSRFASQRVAYDADGTHETVMFRTLFGAALRVPGTTEARPRPRLRPPTAPPLVAISGQQSPTRALSLERWASLLAAWAGDRPFGLAAAPADREFADRLLERFPGQASPFSEEFDGLCARIASAEELFSVDGGPVHIASYYGVPTTAVFTSGRSGKWAPLPHGSRVLVRDDLFCQPCTLFGQTPPCPYGLACHELDPEQHARRLWTEPASQDVSAMPRPR